MHLVIQESKPSIQVRSWNGVIALLYNFVVRERKTTKKAYLLYFRTFEILAHQKGKEFVPVSSQMNC